MFYSDVWVDRGRDGEKLLHQEDSMVADDPVIFWAKLKDDLNFPDPPIPAHFIITQCSYVRQQIVN